LPSAPGLTAKSVKLATFVDCTEASKSAEDHRTRRPQNQHSAGLIVQAMQKTTEPDALASLAGGLKAVADKLTAEQASKPAAEAAGLIVQAMQKTTSPMPWLPWREV
jgi:hypothetical protein